MREHLCQRVIGCALRKFFEVVHSRSLEIFRVCAEEGVRQKLVVGYRFAEMRVRLVVGRSVVQVSLLDVCR